MYALFEEAGKFLAGRILSEAETSAQVELESGKRVKVKAANILLKFEKPSPSELLAQAKAVADAHLRGTSLAWTILAPSRLTDQPGTGRIEVGAQQPSQIPRADVAATIAHVLGEGSRASLHRTLTMNTGDTPVAEAIA